MKHSLILLTLLAVPCVITSCKDDAENQATASEKVVMIYDKIMRDGPEKGAFYAGYRGDTTNLEKRSGDAIDWYVWGAALAGRTELVLQCLALGEHVSRGDALEGAAAGGHKDLVQTLLDKGADPSRGLRGAAMGGHSDLVQLMLGKGADPDAGLQGAAQGGHLNIVKLMFEHGADRKDKPLAFASGFGHCDIVQFLLQRGTDPNVGLKYAAEMGQAAVLKLLLAHPNIRVNEKDYQGKTPLDYAAEKGHTECVNLLRAAGGKRGNEL